MGKDAFIELPKLKGDSVEAVITDPPYDFSKAQKEELVEQFLRVARGAVIIFGPPENQWPAEQYGFWVKPVSTKNTSRRYSRFVEMIFVVRGGKWITGRHWSQYTNVFTDLVAGRSEHPYEKPMSLMERLVLNHTEPGDIVLDPFMGSGTTGIACRNHGRGFLGWDIT